ncbi:DEAD/DEAH box helicase family protein [Marinobacterium jannaschii]|uniref:hypothetical protein n=1 Tax=Marinobacterium jannaschii TaxID=64970 RepID=UPI000B247473|nr:hypothetical protein [Marinobacterium jannaschii]
METANFSAWNPGIETEIPAAYLGYKTIACSANVESDIADIEELKQLTGLNYEELVAFKPQRLVLHELIVRVTADLVVLEGELEEDLGKNFRRMTLQILQQYIQPEMAEIEQAYAQLRQQLRQQIGRILDQTLFHTERTPAPERGFWQRLFSSRHTIPAVPAESSSEKVFRVISEYREKGIAATDPLESAIYHSLYRVLGSTSSRSGYLGNDRDFLVRLVSQHTLNGYGSREIGRLIQPMIDCAAEAQGYGLIRNVASPALFSLKGASAAGKSSLRPMLDRMMQERGVATDCYATISPDIWRRLLLDYEALGEAYKYAGPFSSDEVVIIDAKLDRYIRDKAQRYQSIPHLLVDRFRFDSFSTERISRVLHGTYAEYVETLFMYFVVTPPEATVERGWERGLIKGRYKAVEDFLGHSVEAYEGMPKILFKWLAHERPDFRYEFLDNSVPKGTFPETIARGNQKQISIYKPMLLVNMERYRKINIRARSPQEVYPDAEKMAVSANLGFIRRCIREIPEVHFCDPISHECYLSFRDGAPNEQEPALLRKQLANPEMADLLGLLSPALVSELL